MSTNHARTRAQQRAIPPLVDRLLDEFGDEAYDGHGAIRVYFSHRSRGRMERAFGSHAGTRWVGRTGCSPAACARASGPRQS